MHNYLHYIQNGWNLACKQSLTMFKQKHWSNISGFDVRSELQNGIMVFYKEYTLIIKIVFPLSYWMRNSISQGTNKIIITL